MSLVIRVGLLTESFDGADSDDPRRAEWPPHPARLFCALVAAARGDDDRRVLTWLEGQDPPAVYASREVSEAHFGSFVVVNKLAAKGGNLTHPARSNVMRERAKTIPGHQTMYYEWSGATLSDPDLQRLDAMCRRVPYLGRSTGVAVLAISSAVGLAEAITSGNGVAKERYVQYQPDQAGDVALRVPYPGYLTRLERAYENNTPVWDEHRSRPYRLVDPQTDPTGVVVAEPSLYRDLVIFTFLGLVPEGRLATRFTTALRQHVLAAAKPDVPDILHGHDADGRPHVAFLALPHVATHPRARNGDHADGHLLGLAVATPHTTEQVRRQVLRAVNAGGELHGNETKITLQVPKLGSVTLVSATHVRRPWGLNNARWCQASNQWVSVTPVMLDRYPKRPTDVENIIRRSVVGLHLPNPLTVEVSTHPLAQGAVAMRPVDLPDKDQFNKRLFRHVKITFDRPVAGPLLLGAGRYLGVGLLAPIISPTRGHGPVRGTEAADATAEGVYHD